MKNPSLKALYLLLSLFVMGAPGVFGQGNLFPPGPPGPTMKRLDQVEPRTLIESLPFTISEPGSYYLTTNLTGTAEEDGIIIEADDVALDLNGFLLIGAAEAGNGITVAGERRNLVLRNGTVRGWAIGVNASGASASRFEYLQVSENTGAGLVAGPGSVVQHCVAAENGTGITVNRDSRIESSSAISNLGNGIVLAQGRSQVLHSLASLNHGHGISAASHSFISHSSTLNNQQSGIAAEAGVHIQNAKSSHNGRQGFLAVRNAFIQQSSANYNSRNGIVAGEDSHVKDSQGNRNSQAGIDAKSGSTIEGCTAEGNGTAGIQVTSGCLVRGNFARNNFNAVNAAGIRATGRDNVIRQNTLIANDRGLSVESDGNLLLQNSAANNSLNYFITGTQTQGPVLSGPMEETPHPWANFEF